MKKKKRKYAHIYKISEQIMMCDVLTACIMSYLIKDIIHTCIFVLEINAQGLDHWDHWKPADCQEIFINMTSNTQKDVPQNKYA